MTHTYGLTVGKILGKLGIFKKCTTKVLTWSGREALDDLSNEYGEKISDSKWRIRIPESKPVKFNAGQPSAAAGLHPEFYGDIVFPGEKWPFASHSICIRVWSSRKDLNYWPTTDSESARKEFEEQGERRLILRIRFDHHEPKAGNSISHHPWFHMQIGGKSRIESHDPRCVPPVGYYRYPSTIDTPRFPVFPMSFILVGRFILANYHPEDYARLVKNNDEWNALIAKEEKTMWTEFFEEHSRHLGSDLKTESCFDRTSMDSSLGWPHST